MHRLSVPLSSTAIFLGWMHSFSSASSNNIVGSLESAAQCFETTRELYDAVDAYLLDGSEDTEVANTYGWPIGTWCVDSITDFDDVFSAVRNRQALQFNEDISAWNVGRATRMNRMFLFAASFDQDLCEWRDSVNDSVSVNFIFRGTDCQNTRAPNLESFCSACEQPTGMPSTFPSMQPEPSATPSALPSRTSSETPSQSQSPSGQPSLPPTLQPKPSLTPSGSPSEQVSALPSLSPTGVSSEMPSDSQSPSAVPSRSPTVQPEPSLTPTGTPSKPSRAPSGAPSKSLYPTRVESQTPSLVSSMIPTASVQPSVLSSVSPSDRTSGQPSLEDSMNPTQSHSPTQPPSTFDPTIVSSGEPTTSESPTLICFTCVVLDFDDLSPGEYVTDQLEEDYYVTIRAYASTGGYTPGGAARIFDSWNPGTTANGDPDLGSPNEACPGGGPGKGRGGAPGMPFSNCDPLGNVLIIQESDKAQPDDNARGGRLTFRFTEPVTLDEVTILDIDDHDVITLRVEASDGTVSWIQTADTGHNAVIPTAINIDDVTELKVYFPSSGAIAELKYCLCPELEGTPDPTVAPTVIVTDPPTIVPTESPTTTCPFLHMDFEELTRGQYVTDDLFDDYKVTIEARAARVGYTPDGAARAFDTALPGTNADGDPDLGSPNEMCPGGGPGRGEGGEPGAPYPNCDPQGMVLIIQESDKITPDDVSDGGILTFDFYTPVYLVEIAILDIDEGENNPSVNITDTSGQLTKYDLPTIGNNGVYPLQVGVDNVTQVMVWFPLGGAVAHVDYYLCPEPTATPTVPVPIGSPAPSLVTSAPSTATESPSYFCPLLHLDFEELSRGQYVTDELFDDYWVTIRAYAEGEGYTPGDAARAFDTSNPGAHPDGDEDLGSPNENCPGGGPGVGEGGGPDAPYPNCVPLGMVLIIQESDKPTPDDVAEGGTISFDFDIPVSLVELAILDIDDGPDPPVVRITDISGTRTKFEIPTVGNNGLYPLQINIDNVVQAKVYFPANGAVAHLDYFPCPDRRRHV